MSSKRKASALSSQSTEFKKFEGICPALITPFTSEGKVNVDVLPSLVEYYIEAGVTGLYLCGTTGSGVALAMAERKQVTSAVCAAGQSRIAIVVMVGACPIDQAIELAKHAKVAGAYAVSSTFPGAYTWFKKDGKVVTPPASLDEAIAYFQDVAKATDLPFWPYWLGNGAFKGSAREFLDLMYTVPNFAGSKFTSQDMFTFQQIKQLSEQDGKQLTLVTGCDEMHVCGLVMNSDGGIGSTYNLMPNLFVRLREAFKADKTREAMRLQSDINKVIALLIDVCKCRERGSNIIGGLMCVLRHRGFDVGHPRAQMVSHDFSKEQEKALLDGIAAMDFKVC